MPKLNTPYRDLLPPLSTEEREALKASIKNEGVRDKITVDENDNILDGHHRYEIDSDAPRRVLNGLTDGEKRAFVFQANFARRNLSPDQRRAAQKVMKDVARVLREEDAKKNTQSRVAALLGVAQQTISDWWKSTTNTASGNSGKNTPDARVKVAAPAKAKIAERVAKGESQAQVAADFGVSQQAVSKIAKQEKREAETRREISEAAERLRGEESSSIGWMVTEDQGVAKCNALITDPPYGVLDEPWEPKKLESFTRDWASRWAKCDARCIAVFWSQKFLWDGREWFDESFRGYDFQQMLVWHYPNSMMRKAGPNFKNSWDPVFFYLKRGATMDLTVHADNWGDGLSDIDCMVAAIPQSNFNDSDKKLHPAQKPVKVMRWLVSTLSFPGELIADPFCGSGTTGIASLQLGRKFHGVETDAAFLKMARGRIAKFGESKE